MADPFIGEIRTFPYGFVPYGWALCNGQLLSVSQYQMLYSIIGNQFGGTQSVNFKVPNLMGYAVAGVGSGPGLSTWTWGQTAGAPTATVTTSGLATHTHTVRGQHSSSGAVGLGMTGTPSAKTVMDRLYGEPGNASDFAFTPAPAPVAAPGAVVGFALGNAQGAADAHANEQPYLPLYACICVEDGEYPMRP